MQTTDMPKADIKQALKVELTNHPGMKPLEKTPDLGGYLDIRQGKTIYMREKDPQLIDVDGEPVEGIDGFQDQEFASKSVESIGELADDGMNDLL